jgi:lysozyme family protein
MRLLKPHTAQAVASRLLEHKDRFLAVQAQTKVPALWLMPTFEREGPSFSCYFGNGDPLDRPTTDVPRGRGPFASWELGVCDALHLDHVDEEAVWTWEYACYEWERWNGFGPRGHGRPTGYLWSGTSEYRGGKYVSDGIWSPRTWDEQLGAVIIAKTIAAADGEIAKGFVAG